MVIKTQFLTRTFVRISAELSLLFVSQQQQVLWLLHSSFDTGPPAAHTPWTNLHRFNVAQLDSS